MADELKKKNGGARPGAGRKKGGTNKISADKILKSIEDTCGKPFEELLAQGYYSSIINQDVNTRLQYEKMFINKVVADKQEVDVTSKGEKLNIGFNFPKVELDDWK
jgi:hypothetical protein